MTRNKNDLRRLLSGDDKPKIKIGTSATPSLIPPKEDIQQTRANVKVVVRIRPMNQTLMKNEKDSRSIHCHTVI
ncbi:hypothetical protein QYM36_006849 [Artemia franciscana]|uniref:Kinesin motor domain-containing protein n=1 Tax=Artemia franciscana TaxID=6661 RepID=A0AA88I714_ARTSF|nr:hypothetical protein QYM36_006849 [Artemia franciscana]